MNMKAQCPRCKSTMQVTQGFAEQDATCSGCGATLVVPAAEPARPAQGRAGDIDEAILGMASDIREIRNLIAAVLVLGLVGAMAVVALRMSGVW